MRTKLSSVEVALLNRKITALFFSYFDLNNIHVFHTFIPLERKCELNTWPIIDYLRKNFPLIDIVVPKNSSEDGVMNSCLLSPDDKLVKNVWGIEEPEGNLIVDPQKIDLVLVPLLAFDQAGHRVGYGKGYYDRFLASCRDDVVKVGLSYFSAIEIITDTQNSDISLDYCFTPHRVYKF